MATFPRGPHIYIVCSGASAQRLALTQSTYHTISKCLLDNLSKKRSLAIEHEILGICKEQSGSGLQ